MSRKRPAEPPPAREPLRFFGRDLSVAFVGHLAAKSLGILTFVILTRTLGKAEFALFVLSDAVFQIALQLSELGLETGLVRFAAKGLRHRDHDATDRLLKAAFAAKLATGTLVYLTGYLAAPFIAGQVLQRPELVQFLRVALLGLFGTHLAGFYQAYFGARLQFDRNALFSALTPLGIFLGVVVAWWTGQLTAMTTVRIYALVPIVVCAAAVLVLPHDFLRAPTTVEPLRRVWRFSRWIYATNTLAEVRFRLNSIYLSRLTTLDEVGLYGYGDKLASTITLFTNTILTVFVPRASHLVTQEEIQQLLRRTYRWMLILVTPLCVVPLLSRPLIAWLAPAYAAAAPVFSLLFVSVIFSLAALPSRTVLYSVNRPAVETAIEGVAIALTLVGGYLLVRAHGAIGASVAMVIQRLVSSLLCMGWIYFHVYRAPRERVETPHLTGVH